MQVKLDWENELIEVTLRREKNDALLSFRLRENGARELASKLSQALADLEEYNIRNRVDD